MAAHSGNRYAIFGQGDSSPPAVAPIDDSYKAFVNQVADDSIPWQEVGKRGPSQARAAVKTLIIKPIRSTTTSRAETRDRATSYSTTTSNGRSYVSTDSHGYDKPINPYENWCGVCSQKFSSKSAILNHVKSLPDHDHYCNLCKRVFKDRNGIKNHVENAAGHETFCNMCLSAFKDENGLRDHFRNNKHGMHEFACNGCLTGFSSAQKLEHHMRMHREHAWNSKAATPTIPCWACDALLPTYSGLVNHLESSRCPGFPITSRLINCLGKWWYSPLYMDLDLHAQIRTGRISVLELQQWMNDGFVEPFLCRGEGCDKRFHHFSSLVLHCESNKCDWDVSKLNLTGLRRELGFVRGRSDSMQPAAQASKASK